MDNTASSHTVHPLFKYGCSWDMTPEQKLAVAVIEDALDEVRQKSRYAKSAAKFLCDDKALRFWLAVAGIDNKTIIEHCRKIGRAFFDKSLAGDPVVQLWKKANPRKICGKESVFVFADGTVTSKLELIEQSGLPKKQLEQRLKTYPLITVELFLLPAWQWKLIDKKQYMRKPDRADLQYVDKKSIQVG